MNAVQYALTGIVCVALVSGAGCAAQRKDTTRSSAGQSAPAAKASEDTDTKREALGRKIKIAEARLEQARIDGEIAAASSASSIARAEDDLALARAKFDEFKSYDAPNKIASKELALQRAQDSAVEADEELEQIKIMYKEQDLEDMTAEFVINRGKRNAERRRRSLEITTRELEALVDHAMPREMRGLALDVARKEDALEKANRSARSSELKNRIAVMSAQAKLADLRDELDALDGD